METATLRLIVDSSGSKTATKQLDGLTKSSRNAEKNVERLGNQSSKASDQLRKLSSIMGLIAGSYMAREILRMADAMKQAEAQIKLVTKATDNYKQIMREVLNVANRTYSEFESMTSLYTRTTRAMSQYGRSSQEVLRFTESVANAMRVGGVSAQEQASAIMQLSQALGSGKLAGDEFRSLMETAPVMMQRVADSIGVNIGQLKALAAEGELTADVIFNAMIEGYDEFAEKAASIPPTVSQSLTVLRNNLMAFIGDLDSATGISGAFASSIEWVANNLKDLAFILGSVVVASMGTLISGLGGVTGAVAALTTGFRLLTAAMMRNPFGLLIVGLSYLIVSMGETGKTVYILRSIFSDVANAIVDVWGKVKDMFGALGDFIGETFKDVTGTTRSETEKWGGIFGDFFDDTGEGFWGFAEKAAKVFDAIGATVRSFATYSGELMGALGQSIGAVWTNIKVAILQKVEDVINGMISGINKVFDFLGIGGMGKLSLNVGDKNDTDYFGQMRGFNEIMDTEFERQSNSGLQAMIRAKTDEYNKSLQDDGIRGAYVEVSGAQIIDPNNSTGGGKKSGGKASTQDRTLESFMSEINSMSREAMELSQTLEQMRLNNGLVSDYDALSDLQREITTNAEKYNKYSAEQIEQLKEQARIIDEMEQKKAIMGFASDEAKRLDDMRFELELIGKTAEEVDRLRFIRELNNKAHAIMIGMSEENKNALRGETQALIEQRDELVRRREEIENQAGMDWRGGVKNGIKRVGDNMLTLNKIMEDGTVNAVNSVGDAFGELATTGKANIKDMTASILNDFAKMFAKMAIMNVATGLFGNMFGGNIFGSMPAGYAGMTAAPIFAAGGAFSNGVQFFADGGIVNRATSFGMAGGRKGIMGEAGPEAIMPLSRGRDGKLGVRFEGGGDAGKEIVINQTTIINSDGSSESSGEGATQVVSVVKRIVADTMQKELRPGGALNLAIKGIK